MTIAIRNDLPQNNNPAPLGIAIPVVDRNVSIRQVPPAPRPRALIDQNQASQPQAPQPQAPIEQNRSPLNYMSDDDSSSDESDFEF